MSPKEVTSTLVAGSRVSVGSVVEGGSGGRGGGGGGGSEKMANTSSRVSIGVEGVCLRKK